LDGRPNYTDEAVTGEVWGYGATSQKPVWLAQKMDATKPLEAPAMPLSPLFALDRTRRNSWLMPV